MNNMIASFVETYGRNVFQKFCSLFYVSEPPGIFNLKNYIRGRLQVKRPVLSKIKADSAHLEWNLVI
jgi:hypothetical protein